MKTLTIKLRQHTPLIHFQHDQEGATLRASEVKPKLDRFILTHLGKANSNNTTESNYYDIGKKIAAERNWLVGKGEHPALNFKLRIVADDVITWDINERKKYRNQDEKKGREYITDEGVRYLAKRKNGRLTYDLNQFPLFFANIDADYNNPEEIKKFSLAEEPLIIQFCFLNESIFSFINNNPILLNEFFFNTNFGTRQTKGFGSFSIDKSDPLFRPQISKYRFNIYPDGGYIEDALKEVFEKIEMFYKTLRGGINLKNRDRKTIFYFKSLAYLYAEKVLNAKWDKRKIKEEFYNDNDYQEKQSPHTYDIRDMLGFSTNEQWKEQRDTIEKKVAIWDEQSQRYTYPRRNDKLPVERMPSPILFKPIYDEDEDKYTINIILQDEQAEMSKFKTYKKICIYSRKGNRFMIDLPQAFSTKSFFKFIFDKEKGIDLSMHVDQTFQDHEYYDILEDIFSQIQSNI